MTMNRDELLARMAEALRDASDYILEENEFYAQSERKLRIEDLLAEYDSLPNLEIEF